MSKGHLDAMEALKLLRAADLKTFRELRGPVTLHRQPPATVAKVQKARARKDPKARNLPPEPTHGESLVEVAKAALHGDVDPPCT